MDDSRRVWDAPDRGENDQSLSSSELENALGFPSLRPNWSGRVMLGGSPNWSGNKSAWIGEDTLSFD